VGYGSGLGGDVSEGAGGIRLTDEQRIDWLRLIRSQNVGPRGIMAQTPQEVNP
jgi:gluconate kinase